jgi:glycosyltransferase involved in cell wall biosynthesis
MRIAVFHDLSSGGAKRVLHDFVRYLAGNGHDVDAYCPSTADETFLPLKQVARKVEVFPVKKTLSGAIYSRLLYVPMRDAPLRDQERTQQEIAESVNRQDYDVVISEQDRYTLSPFFLKFIKKPTVYCCQQPSRFHDLSFRDSQSKSGVYPQPTRWRRTVHKYYDSRLPDIDRENASFARFILANSYYSRESILRSYGLNAHVSYLGVDTEVFKPLGIPKENIVLSVGSCFSSKGFDFIINSLALVDKRIRPELVITSNSGDPTWKSYLEQLASRAGVNMEIRGAVVDSELVSLYNRARLVLCASYLEPFGLVPIEAMACGTPVIAVREGGFRESVVHDQTGKLVDRDCVEFSRAVSQLITDSEARGTMGQKGLNAVRNFWTLKHAGERLEAHLRRALETHPN